ncbi:hypothetical protein NXS19_009003 [Fusarium pseudograminearum]|nr:hypothetical protein NXS19_009003 [Fusarium pseudograminearum]
MSLRRLLHVHGRGVPRGPSSWDLIDAVKFRSARVSENFQSTYKRNPHHIPRVASTVMLGCGSSSQPPSASTGVDDLELFRGAWRPG